MAKDPKEMLPQQWVAASRGIKKRPVEHALEFEQDVAGNEGRKGEQDHAGHHQDIPGIKGDEIDTHARRTTLEHPDREFNRGQGLKGLKSTTTFTTPEVMVPFKCDVHRWMNAWVGVLEHPFYVRWTQGELSAQEIEAGIRKALAT